MLKSLKPWLSVLVLAIAACGRGGRVEAPAVAPEPVAAPKPAVKSRPATAARPDSVAKRKPAARKAPAATARKPAPPKVDSTALEFAVTARHAHQPLARAIARRTRNPEIAERAAWAVTREAARLRLSPSLVAAVLLIENRPLDSSAVSSQGAIGLMQVMPIHAGSYGCASDDLRTVDANICHGTRILHRYIKRSKSVARGLRRYNGCVRGTNTPGCFRYPARVLRTAGRIRRELLASNAAHQAKPASPAHPPVQTAPSGPGVISVRNGAPPPEQPQPRPGRRTPA